MNNDIKPTSGSHPLLRLTRKQPTDPHAEYPEIAEMKSALNRAGYDASEADIQWAWEEHSKDWGAGWLTLDICGDADGAVIHLLDYLTATTEPPPDFPPAARNFLTAFYKARSANSVTEKIVALKQAYNLENSIVTANESKVLESDELKVLEFYALTKAKII